MVPTNSGAEASVELHQNAGDRPTAGGARNENGISTPAECAYGHFQDTMARGVLPTPRVPKKPRRKRSYVRFIQESWATASRR
jgi:hypothetical protein